MVGAGRAFEIATMVAIIPALVPRPVVPSATAWFASSNQIGVIVGPILGGLLYELGPGTVYGLAVSFWLIGASFIFLIHMESVPRASEPVSLQSLMGGFDFVWRDRVILGTISLDMCAVFLAGALALFPVFARDILETGPWGLGLLRAAPGVGAFAMSVLLAQPAADAADRQGAVRRGRHLRRLPSSSSRCRKISSCRWSRSLSWGRPTS